MVEVTCPRCGSLVVINIPNCVYPYHGSDTIVVCSNTGTTCDEPVVLKAVVRRALLSMRDTPKREMLHELIIEISVGVDD